MDVNGAEEEYNYEIECGIGRVAVGDSEYSGLGNSKKLGFVHEKCAVENGMKLLRSRILFGLTFGRGVNIIIPYLHFRELRISKKNAYAHMQESTYGRL